MKNLNLLSVIFCILLMTGFASAQNVSVDGAKTVETTPAFTMLASHKLVVESELQKLLTGYTAIHPDVLKKQSELEAIEREMTQMSITSEAKLSRLTTAYGRLLIRKFTEEANLRHLLGRFTRQHPEVIEATKKLKMTENKLSEKLQ